MSGRIQTYKDDTGAIFIDRDPQLFRIILNYLRNRSLSLDEVNLKELKHEAEFYGIAPLVKKLSLCEVRMLYLFLMSILSNLYYHTCDYLILDSTMTLQPDGKENSSFSSYPEWPK